MAVELQEGFASCDLAHWLHVNLIRLNAEALSGARTAESLIDEFNAVTQGLSSPVRCSADDCPRLLVMLGMIGSTAERHSQEAGNPPGRAVNRLSAGGWPFRRYVATLSSRTGGPPRDSLLSYVTWNAPTVNVYLPDAQRPFLTLPSVFPEDGQAGPFTFTDHPGERAFIFLMKRCAALEEAANDHLWPVVEGTLALGGHQAVRHVDAAAQFLKSVRAEMRLFMQRPEFTAPFFLDVLRQFACAWDTDEPWAAPSGGHDAAFIARDKMLATTHPSYDEHIDLQFNVLDGKGQNDVLRACKCPSLVSLLERELKLPDGDLSQIADGEAAELAFHHPWLAAYFRLFEASGDVAAAHWAIIYKYMVGPMRERNYDAVVVSNFAGTTHMLWDTLRDYTSTRTNHPMAGFKDVFKVARSQSVSVKVDMG
jgi:hypothetical protein